jgi:hypothetical protein
MNQISKQNRFIYKDELCDAKWSKTNLTCQRGTLKFTGNNVSDFNLYRAWCKDCEKIKVVDRKDFIEQFKNFVKAVDRELEEL